MEKPPKINQLPENTDGIPMLESNNKVLTMSEGAWIEEVADKVVQVFPDKEVYTCAAGISPSGIVHFGNFRDVMTSLVLFKELEKKGKKTRFLFSWDDFDRLRKVPANVDPSFSQYIGLPLTQVPDPTGETESYARHLELQFENSMKDLGIELEYRYQTKEYQSGRYDEQIIKALNSREKIAEMLLARMSSRGKEEKGIDSEKYKKDYYPISLYSRFTGKDNTKILNYDGDSQITYRCLDTGQEETIDLRKDHVVKLQWKIDWPMRWQEEGVVFEPGGQDHATPNGSYDASSQIAKEVFGIQPPIFVGYEFIGIRGLEGKMSGSKGNAVTPEQLLKIYQPDLLKWLYLRRNPHQKFELAFDTEVYRQYDEFDRAVKEHTERKGDGSSMPLSLIEDINQSKLTNPIPFRQAVAFGQILNWNSEKIDILIKKLNLNYDQTSVTERLSKAKAWLEEYNEGEMIKLRETPNQEYLSSMNDLSKNQIKELRDFLLGVNFEDISIEDIEKVLYAIPRKNNTVEAELKKSQRAFFKDVYQLLISKETGPRLPTFIWAVGKEKILNLLNTD